MNFSSETVLLTSVVRTHDPPPALTTALRVLRPSAEPTAESYHHHKSTAPHPNHLSILHHGKLRRSSLHLAAPPPSHSPNASADDHNISRPASTPRAPRQRLDLSSFFESLNSQTTDGAQTDAEAPDAYRNLAEQFTHLPDTPLLQGLISQLLEGPKKAEGVPEGYFETLERVDKKRLGEKTCPICAEKFADGE